MTRSPVGLFFSSYDYGHLLRNDIIEQTLREAVQKIKYQLAINPNLVNKAVDKRLVYVQEEHGYLLDFAPNIPAMTYGDIPVILPLISAWATQYIGVECYFDIFARPGTSAQRRLGLGQIRLASNPPKMPGRAGFRYHMTPDKPFGLIFTRYDYFETYDNDDVEQSLVRAENEIYRMFAPDPTLANQTCNFWEFDDDLHPIGEYEDFYSLSIEPNGPAMTWNDVRTVVAVLATWAREYRAVKTEFQIWAQPGTGEQRFLGSGRLLLITP
ncbi:MAG: hypothetical protein Q9226_004786 [Calogaya cf. arnoldii]